MHINTHNRTNIIGRHTQENVYPYHHNADAFDDAAQPSDMDSDSEGAGPWPDDDNDPGAPGTLLPLQRIEHPYLSGWFMIFWAILSL